MRSGNLILSMILFILIILVWYCLMEVPFFNCTIPRMPPRGGDQRIGVSCLIPLLARAFAGYKDDDK